MEVNQTTMAALLHRIADLRTRTYRLVEYEEVSQPGLPATEDQILAVEQKFQCALPPSYRLFLSIYNGWEHWSGDLALLSTDQMLSGEYAERIEEWRNKQLVKYRDWLHSCVVIGFSLFVGEQILIDFSSHSKRDVVIWQYRELQRFRDFYDYLVDFEGTLKEELASDLQA